MRVCGAIIVTIFPSLSHFLPFSFNFKKMKVWGHFLLQISHIFVYFFLWLLRTLVFETTSYLLNNYANWRFLTTLSYILVVIILWIKKKNFRIYLYTPYQPESMRTIIHEYYVCCSICSCWVVNSKRNTLYKCFLKYVIRKK